jgi:hypothetical protein
MIPRSLIKRVITSTLIRTGAGVLRAMRISNHDASATAGYVNIYDGIDDTGTLLHSEYVTGDGLNRRINFKSTQISTGIYVKIITTADVAVSVSYL